MTKGSIWIFGAKIFHLKDTDSGKALRSIHGNFFINSTRDQCGKSSREREKFRGKKVGMELEVVAGHIL